MNPVATAAKPLLPSRGDLPVLAVVRPAPQEPRPGAPSDGRGRPGRDRGPAARGRRNGPGPACLRVRGFAAEPGHPVPPVLLEGLRDLVSPGLAGRLRGPLQVRGDSRGPGA